MERAEVAESHAFSTHSNMSSPSPSNPPPIITVPPPPQEVVLIDPDTMRRLVQDICSVIKSLRDKAEQTDTPLDDDEEAYLSMAASKASDFQHFAKMHYAELRRLALHARGLLADLRFTEQRKEESLEAHLERARHDRDTEELRRLLKRGIRIQCVCTRMLPHSASSLPSTSHAEFAAQLDQSSRVACVLRESRVTILILIRRADGTGSAEHESTANVPASM